MRRTRSVGYPKKVEGTAAPVIEANAAVFTLKSLLVSSKGLYAVSCTGKNYRFSPLFQATNVSSKETDKRALTEPKSEVYTMAFVINFNQNVNQAQSALNQNRVSFSRSFERLASGARINGASDDAAGLSISTRIEAQVRGHMSTCSPSQRRFEFTPHGPAAPLSLISHA